MDDQAHNIETRRPDEDSMMSTNFAMMIRLRGDFSTEQLLDALARVRSRHSVLVTKINPGDPSSFRPLPENAPRFPVRVLTGCGEADWIEVAKAELRQSLWNEAGPFARFILLRLKDASDIVGVFNHGICDGISGVYFFRDILRLLGQPDVELPPIPVPPNSFTLIPKSVSENPQVKRQVAVVVTMLRLSVFLQGLRKRLFPKRQKTASIGQGSQDSIPAAQRFCILPASLNASQTAALVTRCRAEQTSVHAAICTAWLRAFANTLEGRKSWVRSVSSPVNLRERLPQTVDETSGLFMSTVETHLNCTPGRDFWQSAREFKQKLSRGSIDEKLFMMPMIFRTVFSRLTEAERGQFIEYFFGQPVKYDFSITNIGRLDIPIQNGALQVETFYGPLVNSSEHERTVGVSTLGDKMTFTFVFRESKMEPAQGEFLMRQALKQLENAAAC